jgi:hypothetical protein
MDQDKEKFVLTFGPVPTLTVLLFTVVAWVNLVVDLFRWVF